MIDSAHTVLGPWVLNISRHPLDEFLQLFVWDACVDHFSALPEQNIRRDGSRRERRQQLCETLTDPEAAGGDLTRYLTECPLHKLRGRNRRRTCANVVVAGTTAAWTAPRRAQQADIIRRTRPWTRSTGPKTPAGKKVSSKNALRFRNNPEARLAYDLTLQFLATGLVPPALAELWLAAHLSPLSDDCCNDLLRLSGDWHEELLGEHVGNLVDFPFDEPLGDGEIDRDYGVGER